MFTKRKIIKVDNYTPSVAYAIVEATPRFKKDAETVTETWVSLEGSRSWQREGDWKEASNWFNASLYAAKADNLYRKLFEKAKQHFLDECSGKLDKNSPPQSGSGVPSQPWLNPQWQQQYSYTPYQTAAGTTTTFSNTPTNYSNV